MVDGTRHHEQQVGQAIQIDDDGGVGRSRAEADYTPLGAATDRPRQMQQRPGRRSARQNEAPQRRELRLQAIDRLFELVDLVIGDRGLGHTSGDSRRRVGQPRPDRKQVALDRLEDPADVRVDPGGARGAEARVQLVDLAVRIDPRIRLRDPRIVEQRGFAGVAGFCVNLHPVNYKSRVSPSPLPVPAARQRFRRRLLAWYHVNGRDLPWRRTDDPYHILVSEVMLQQTQVDRVLPKYHEWLEKYPSLEALAAAPEGDVSETWRPLGYNIRPRRLQSIARESVARYGGELPSDEATLLSFKGIGEYTAGAVLSFAFGQRKAILDTNVARVLYRIFVGKGDPKAHAMKRHLWEVSRTVLPMRHVFDFNQALMDFGATHCSARKPKCPTCPMRAGCASYPFKASV